MWHPQQEAVALTSRSRRKPVEALRPAVDSLEHPPQDDLLATKVAKVECAKESKGDQKGKKAK